jgi:hypothetical protein
MMATVRHVTSKAEHTKFQAAWFLLDIVYKHLSVKSPLTCSKNVWNIVV